MQFSNAPGAIALSVHVGLSSLSFPELPSSLVVRDLLSERVARLLALNVDAGWRSFETFFCRGHSTHHSAQPAGTRPRAGPLGRLPSRVRSTRSKSGRESSRYGLVFIFAVIGSECCIYRQLRLMSGGHTRRKRQRETEAPQKRWGHGNNLPG